MASVNELLRDAGIGRQVDVVLHSNWLVRKVMALLNKSDAELFARLTQALETMSPNSFTVERLEQQLLAVRELNATVYDKVANELDSHLRKFTAVELGFQGELLETPTPGIRIPLVALAPETVYAAVLARPFQGRLLREWSKGLGEARALRIRDTIRMGFTNGETIDEMVRKVRGTKAKGYSDGILHIDRRNAEAVVRTAVSHTAAVARENLYQANSDLVKAVQWSSTLDERTTSACQARDGRHYSADRQHKPIGHAMPWGGGPGQLHWNCRSSSIPVLKSWDELGLAGLAELDPKTRASMDGQVAAGTTYGQWFGKQSAERQNRIVGPARGKLFREGKVTFEQFTNNKGQLLTLEQLQQSR